VSDNVRRNNNTTGIAMDNLNLAKRLFDIALFIIAFVCLVTAVIIGFFATHSESKMVLISKMLQLADDRLES
jgi:hypothetical protein